MRPTTRSRKATPRIIRLGLNLINVPSPPSPPTLFFALGFPFRASLATTKLETKAPTNTTYTLNMAQKARDSVRVLAEDIAAHRDPTGEVEVDTTVPKSNPNFCLLVRGHL